MHTRINSEGLFLVNKLTCGKRESVSWQYSMNNQLPLGLLNPMRDKKLRRVPGGRRDDTCDHGLSTNRNVEVWIIYKMKKILPRVCSVRYVPRRTGGIYRRYYGTGHFGKFGTTSIPVPDTSVSSVRHQYRYRRRRHGLSYRYRTLW